MSVWLLSEKRERIPQNFMAGSVATYRVPIILLFIVCGGIDILEVENTFNIMTKLVINVCQLFMPKHDVHHCIFFVSVP